MYSWQVTASPFQEGFCNDCLPQAGYLVASLQCNLPRTGHELQHFIQNYVENKYQCPLPMKVNIILVEM